MNFGTRLFIVAILAAQPPAVAAEMREQVLKQSAIKAGLLQTKNMVGPIDQKKSRVGGLLFQLKSLSFNANISCQDCHLDSFSSADGLPNAVGVGGHGQGFQRLNSEGAIVPRNTHPLWGRGSVGFNTLFWDGKVQFKDGEIVSQFGTKAPTNDPLELAVHLPFVEMREMVRDDDLGQNLLAGESVKSANLIYKKIIQTVKDSPEISIKLADAFNIQVNNIEFRTITIAITEFIKDRFRIRQTKFHDFVFNKKQLSTSEIRGGLLFYGKGQCVTCHYGSMFTDFKFHTIAFPQLGFGKNGFGRDFGRYNVTFDPNDMYKFRTPPLFNVTHTAPYSHSGSIKSLSDTIRYHFDPLWKKDIPNSIADRQQLYGILKGWAKIQSDFPILDSKEIADVVSFLKTLSFVELHRQK